MLCVCKGRRRLVTFLGAPTVEEMKNLKGEIESVFLVVLPPNQEYFIEREQRVGGLIDLTGFIQDRDILHLNWSKVNISTLSLSPPIK